MGTFGEAFSNAVDTVTDTVKDLSGKGLKDIIKEKSEEARSVQAVVGTGLARGSGTVQPGKMVSGIDIRPLTEEEKENMKKAVKGGARLVDDQGRLARVKSLDAGVSDYHGIATVDGSTVSGGVHTLVSKPVNRFYHGEQERVLASDVLAFQKLISDKDACDQMLAESFEGALSNVTRGQLAKACRNHGINITSEQLDAFEKESVHTADDSVLMTLIDGASGDDVLDLDNGLAIVSDLTDYAVENFEKGKFSGSPESVLGLYAIQDTMNNWSDAIDHSKNDYGLSGFLEQANLSDHLPAISVAAQQGAETHNEAVSKQKGLSQDVIIGERELPEVPSSVSDEPLKGYADYDTFDDM